MDAATLISEAKKLFEQLDQLDTEDRMDVINELRLALHAHSPMRQHPVDCVLWVKQEEVHANAYNPNHVAPPEMAALKVSIETSGYTQPCVTWVEESGDREMVDGAHRRLIGQIATIYESVMGRLPVTTINQDRTGLASRMGATILHNTARGEADVELVQKMVIEVVNSGMSDSWIMKNFGMGKDDILRLKQLTGLPSLFLDKEFSRSQVTCDRDGIEEMMYE